MWYFWSPNIVYGEDAIDFMENIPGEKCLIITDKVLEEIGHVEKLTNKLEKFGKEFKIFNDVEPDPKEDGVLSAREVCLDYQPDLLIALGGGSVMDTAKALWVLYEFPDFKIDDLHPFNPKLYEMGIKSKLIAIPTTSGTGAETTYAAIISVYENEIWKKFVQAHKGIVPTYAILDPIFPLKMPIQLTKDTAFDALAHAMENFANSWKNDFSDAIGLKSVELMFKSLPIVVKEPDNLKARDSMHQAATMAGLAFGNSSVHIGHAMGHSWGALFHTPHGRSVGILTTYIIQYMLNNPEGGEETQRIYGKLAKQLGWANWDESMETAAKKVVQKIKDLQKEIEFPTAFNELDVSKEKFEENLDTLVQLCFEDPTVTMSPRSTNSDAFKKLYRYAFEGKDVDF